MDDLYISTHIRIQSGVALGNHLQYPPKNYFHFCFIPLQPNIDNPLISTM